MKETFFFPTPATEPRFNNRCKNSAKEWRFELGYINCGKKKMLIPTPGIEPGPRRWERRILTTRPCGNRQTSGRKHLVYVVRSAHRNFSICCLCCPFFIFFIQICINMAFCANILLKNRSCLGLNPYPPGRGATPWNSWWGVGGGVPPPREPYPIPD